MNILILGATGASGRQLVQQALALNYNVTAVARKPADLPLQHPNLLIVKGDVLQPSSLQSIFNGQHAVISALGARNTKPTTIFSEGIKHVAAQMTINNVERIICISASAIETSPKLSLIVQLATKLLQRILKHAYSDMMKMENFLKASSLHYTIVRPPRLTNGLLKTDYRFAVNDWLPSCIKISRADLAHFILHHIDDVSTYRSTVEVAY